MPLGLHGTGNQASHNVEKKKNSCFAKASCACDDDFMRSCVCVCRSKSIRVYGIQFLCSVSVSNEKGTSKNVLYFVYCSVVVSAEAAAAMVRGAVEPVCAVLFHCHRAILIQSIALRFRVEIEFPTFRNGKAETERSHTNTKDAPIE